MRIVIGQGIEGYNGVYLEIQDWFARKENIRHVQCDIIRQTERAILLKHGDKETWVPKSIIRSHTIPKGLDAWIQ